MFSSCLRQVGIGSLFMGIGHGIILLCGQHSVTSVPDDTARTAAVGWLSFFNSVGTAAGPLIGGTLRDLYGLHYGFSGAVLLSFGAILASFSMPSTQVKATIHSRAPLRIKKPLVLDIILSGTVFFVADVISVYLPLYTYQMALSGILTGTVLSCKRSGPNDCAPFYGASPELVLCTQASAKLLVDMWGSLEHIRSPGYTCSTLCARHALRPRRNLRILA